MLVSVGLISRVAVWERLVTMASLVVRKLVTLFSRRSRRSVLLPEPLVSERKFLQAGPLFEPSLLRGGQRLLYFLLRDGSGPPGLWAIVLVASAALCIDRPARLQCSQILRGLPGYPPFFCGQLCQRLIDESSTSWACFAINFNRRFARGYLSVEHFTCLAGRFFGRYGGGCLSLGPRRRKLFVEWSLP